MDRAATEVGKQVHVQFDPELARQLEEWRRKQPVIPTTSACVRELVARALSYDSSNHAVA